MVTQHTHAHIYIYIYIYMCVCVCVCGIVIEYGYHKVIGESMVDQNLQYY